MSQKSFWLAFVILLVVVGGVVGFSLHSQKSAERFGGTTNLDSLVLSSTLTTGAIDTVNVASTTINLTAADLLNKSVMSVQGSSTAQTTVNFPASSTLSTFLPNVGDTTSIIVYNATTTGAATLALVAGAGTNFTKATSTLVLGAGDSVVIDIYRQASSSLMLLASFFH